MNSTQLVWGWIGYASLVDFLSLLLSPHLKTPVFLVSIPMPLYSKRVALDEERSSHKLRSRFDQIL